MYDVILAAGVFVEGHIKCSGLYELARITKSNGLIIIIMRKEYLNDSEELNKLEPLTEKMINNGIWKQLLRTEVPKYSFIKIGVAFVFRKN